jgi:MbtH protein
MPPIEEEEDKRTYTVVVNDEEQYSIWFADRELPKGWRAVGKTGPKAECLQYIGEVWTDMRPLSLRKWMAEQEAAEKAAAEKK